MCACIPLQIKLDEAEKKKLYSEHACHELNVFLFTKDPAFFRTVVLPGLRSKKDRTFIDRWLLEDDLAGYLEPWAYGQLNTIERVLLAERIAARGGRLLNADITLICEKPKIAPHAAAMMQRLADLLETDESRISVKATTTERLGFTGRMEGIAAQAVATVLLPD